MISCVSEKNKHCKSTNFYTIMDCVTILIQPSTLFMLCVSKDDRMSSQLVFIKTHLVSVSDGLYSNKTADCISGQ